MREEVLAVRSHGSKPSHTKTRLPLRTGNKFTRFSQRCTWHKIPRRRVWECIHSQIRTKKLKKRYQIVSKRIQEFGRPSKVAAILVIHESTCAQLSVDLQYSLNVCTNVGLEFLSLCLGFERFGKWRHAASKLVKFVSEQLTRA